MTIILSHKKIRKLVIEHEIYWNQLHPDTIFNAYENDFSMGIQNITINNVLEKRVFAYKISCNLWKLTDLGCYYNYNK